MHATSQHACMHFQMAGYIYVLLQQPINWHVHQTEMVRINNWPGNLIMLPQEELMWAAVQWRPLPPGRAAL